MITPLPRLIFWHAVSVPRNPGRTQESAQCLPARAVKSFDVFVSEVGFFTGKGPEGDLFILLKKDVVSTERPVKDRDDVSVNLQPTARFTCLTDRASERYYEAVCVVYLSFRSRCVRRIRRRRSLCLGFSASPEENLRDIFFTDWMSLSNWANSLVSVYLLNSAALLMWRKKKKKHSHIDKKMQSWWNICRQTDGWSENLLVNGRHCYFTVTVEFNSHVSPAHVLVPCHHLQPVACHWERRLKFLYKYFQLKYELINLINSFFQDKWFSISGLSILFSSCCSRRRSFLNMKLC